MRRNRTGSKPANQPFVRSNVNSWSPAHRLVCWEIPFTTSSTHIFPETRAVNVDSPNSIVPSPQIISELDGPSGSFSPSQPSTRPMMPNFGLDARRSVAPDTNQSAFKPVTRVCRFHRYLEGRVRSRRKTLPAPGLQHPYMPSRALVKFNRRADSLPRWVAVSVRSRRRAQGNIVASGCLHDSADRVHNDLRLVGRHDVTGLLRDDQASSV
jgi:hypothetical protein